MIKLTNQDDTAELFLYDIIGEDPIFGGGVSENRVIGLLKEVGPDKPLTVRINSPGGSVWSGMTIHSLLRERTGKTTVKIDGVAASIASVIAMAGDVIEMAPMSQMMIHRASGPSAMAFGDGDTLREAAADTIKTAGLLDEMDSQLVGLYAKSNRVELAEAKIRQMVDAETWMNGETAVSLGFADVVNEVPAVAAKWDLTRYRNAPPEFQSAARDFENRQDSNAKAQIELAKAKLGLQKLLMVD